MHYVCCMYIITIVCCRACLHPQQTRVCLRARSRSLLVEAVEALCSASLRSPTEGLLRACERSKGRRECARRGRTLGWWHTPYYAVLPSGGSRRTTSAMRPLTWWWARLRMAGSSVEVDGQVTEIDTESETRRQRQRQRQRQKQRETRSPCQFARCLVGSALPVPGAVCGLRGAGALPTDLVVCHSPLPPSLLCLLVLSLFPDSGSPF